MPMKLLITGGAGFIGYHIARKARMNSNEVVVIDNLCAPDSSFRFESLSRQGLRLIKGNILTDIPRTGFDAIFHLAAGVSVSESFQAPNEYYTANLQGTLQVLENIRKFGGRLVFASSAAVYGESEDPFTENSALKPINIYGWTKVLGEGMIRSYCETYGISATALRLFNVYGPECHGVLHDLMSRLAERPKGLEVLGTGEQKRDFVFIDDVIDAFFRAAETSNAWRVFNVGSGHTITIKELVAALYSVLQIDPNQLPLSTTGGQSWKGDAHTLWADISHIQRTLGWSPKTSLAQGLAQTAHWYEKIHGRLGL